MADGGRERRLADVRAYQARVIETEVPTRLEEQAISVAEGRREARDRAHGAGAVAATCKTNACADQRLLGGEELSGEGLDRLFG